MKAILIVCFAIGILSGCKSPTTPQDSNPGTKTQAEVLGTVKDSLTLAPIAGAMIELFNMDTVRVGHTVSDGTGSFWLDTVAPGTYYFVVEAPNYDIYVTIIHVVAGTDYPLEARIHPSSHSSGGDDILFHIVSAITRQPLSTATVSIDGSSFPDPVDKNGNSTWYYGSPGTHTFVIAAPGYTSVAQTATFQAGVDLYDTVALLPHVDTLLCKYTFNNSGVDSSGNGHNATLHGGTFVDDRFGNSKSAIKLNGTSDYISIPDHPSLNFGKSKSFSICVWIKCQEQLNGQIYLLSKGTSSGGVFTGYQIVNEYYDFRAFLGTTYGQVTGPSDVIGQDGLWHLLVYCFDRSGSISCYLDGHLYDASTSTYPSTAMQGNLDNAAPILIGGSGKTSGSLAATIDDIRIYEGTLTEDEIMTMFHENGW